MRIIGENIHILSPKVKEAIANRDRKFFQELAVRQVEAGAWAVDLNIGPQKKLGHEILPWLVEAVQEVVDVPLCLDTTNLGGHRGRLRDHQAAADHQLDIGRGRAAGEGAARRQEVQHQADRTDDGSRGHSHQRGCAGQHRAREADPALRRGRHAAGRPDHRPIGAHRQRLPAVCAGVRRGGAHAAGDRRGRAGGPQQRLQRGAQRDAAADQPRLLRHVDGRGARYDDR